MMRYVICIDEYHSLAHPGMDFGRLHSIYRVLPNPTPGYPHYLTLAELPVVGYVNASRFRDVTVRMDK